MSLSRYQFLPIIVIVVVVVVVEQQLDCSDDGNGDNNDYSAIHPFDVFHPLVGVILQSVPPVVVFVVVHEQR